jgi:hypothetical protein
VLVFAIVVGLGVAGAGALLGRGLRTGRQPAGASSVKTPSASV